MPIYAYKCESCGHAKDVLQKMSDALLTDCPHCGESSFKKQLTAAGFQLKGSGWYVTDFRGGDGGTQTAKSVDAATAAPAGTGSKPADAGTAPATAAAVPSAAPVSAAASSSSSSPAKAA